MVRIKLIPAVIPFIRSPRPARLVSPLRLACFTLVFAALVLAPAAAVANQQFKGHGDVSGIRVPDGSLFTLRSDPNSDFRPASSLPGTRWWTTNDQNSPWTSVVDGHSDGDFLAMQIGEGVDIAPGEMFFFGLSFETSLREVRHSIREVNSLLPQGTMFHIGYSLEGSPSGVNPNHLFDRGGNFNNVGLPLGTEPPPLLLESIANQFAWLSFATIEDNPETGEQLRLLITSDDGDGNNADISELVYFIVLPEDQGIPGGTTDETRLAFTWTLDAKGTPQVGDQPNPFFDTPAAGADSDELLAPEPGRALLLAMASALLLLRRSRPLAR